MRPVTRVVLLVALMSLLLVPATAGAAPGSAGLGLNTSANGSWTRTFSWTVAKTVNPSARRSRRGGQGLRNGPCR